MKRSETKRGPLKVSLEYRYTIVAGAGVIPSGQVERLDWVERG